MAGNLEMNGDGESGGHVEVESRAAKNSDDNIGAAPSEKSPLQQEFAEEEPTSIVIASSDKPGRRHKKIPVEGVGINNNKEIINANDMKISDADNKTISDDASATVASNATFKNGQVVASTRTAEEEQKPLKSVLNANATPWSPSDLNRAVLSQAWKLSVPSKKKLLILDVNGLLVARYKKIDRSIIPPNAPHEVVAKSYMFKRPYCDNFLTFCLENFHVGVWTSMMEANVVKALDYICQGMQAKFVFVMHQGDCTPTGLRNPQKRTQPLFLKELVKAWSKFPRGQFNESNTLLIDDTPYKALRNPPHTAIFPEAYLYNEADTFLKGPLMEYLTQLRDAVDVREFVRTHPFGMPAIAPGCLHWNVYQKVLETKVTQAENIGSRLYNTIPELPQTQISSLTVGILLAEEQKRLEILSLT